MTNSESPIKVVILAGGQGTRFWPISRTKRPKQFFSISPTGESLIQATARRLEPLAGKENIIVVTNIIHRPLVEEHIPYAKIICESVGRNTAASIGLAAIYIRRQDANAVMVSLPADHAVAGEDELRRAIMAAVAVAKSGEKLVTIGIKPTSPHTGYGYIKRGQLLENQAYAVGRFYEKPSFERARRYVESGEFFWNSGMFAWRVDTILKSIQDYMPNLYDSLMRIDQSIGTKK